MPKHHLKIGQAAERVQMNPKTIRYYEEIGLLPKASRNASGYRLYSEEDLDRLQFIRRAKLLGLTLTETKHVVQYAV
ncbi:MAG: MerR family transcriptional regulator, partial [Chloroflexi bacterium]|nr:MerR family transcriptional regulator [Chloroflexota bacterium]